MQKEAITRIMEDSKRNQKRAAKLIQKVMKGGIGGGAGAGRRRRRRGSGTNNSNNAYGSDYGSEDGGSGSGDGGDGRSSSASFPGASSSQVIYKRTSARPTIAWAANQTLIL